MTPRSLKRALRKVRMDGGSRTIAGMAKDLRIARETLEKWEGQREELTHALKVQDLQRYQDVLGIPSGIMLLISQILAAARDGRTDHLEVMAAMMNVLWRRIATVKKRRGAVADVQEGKEPHATTFRQWDNYLGVLIGSVVGAVPNALRKSFENPERAAVYDDRHDKKVKGAADKPRARRRARSSKRRPGKGKRAATSN